MKNIVMAITVFYAAQSIQAQVKAGNSFAGCQIAPNDSVFNTAIRNLPVHANSASWINQSLSIGSVPLTFLNSFGVNLVDNKTAITSYPTFNYTPALNGQPFVFASNPRKRENGSLTKNGNADHHLITINHQTCRVYESYQDGGGANGTTAESGYTYISTSYSQPTAGTTDAAGLPLLPLSLHLSELNDGSINHALRFTSCTGCISNQYIWPATYSTGWGSGAAPMGSRWRLKSDFDISRFSAKAQVILRALQNYGMILADIGGINQIETNSDLNLDPTAAAALNEITYAEIDQSQFDIIDETSLMIDSNSQKTTSSQSNALQTVLAGTPYTNLIFQSGQSLLLDSWVNGTSNQTVKWSATSGSFKGSTYTAPIVTAPVAVLLTMTAAESPLATASVYGYIIPAGPILLDVGNPNTYEDALGNLWMADKLGFESGAFSQQNDNYPSDIWGNIVDGQLYETYNYTWGDDISYGPFVVPNGLYLITYYFGRGNCTGSFDPTGNGLTLSPGPVALDVNGSITSLDVSSAEFNNCRRPALTTITANVTNQMLTVALRSEDQGSIQSSPELNALKIVLVTPAPPPLPVVTSPVVPLPIDPSPVNYGFIYKPTTSELCFVDVTRTAHCVAASRTYPPTK